MMMDTFDRIRFHLARGMGRPELERIYGRSFVAGAIDVHAFVPTPFKGRLVSARIKAGHTARQAATLLGCVPGYLTMMEAGTRVPSGPDMVERIAAYLGEDVRALYAELDSLRTP